MGIVNRAWKLQNKIENYLSHINLSLESYFFYCMFLFFFVGIGLFVYCKIFDISLDTLVYTVSPTFYLCLGIGCFISYIAVRFNAFCFK